MLVDCHNLRTLCNDELHGKESAQKRSKWLEQLECHLVAIFQYEKEVSASDHDIFDTPIHELLTLPLMNYLLFSSAIF
jgi:hypothetical protein